MTESEWLACTDPKPMLDFLKGKISDRKLRLFAFACEMKLFHTDESEVVHLVEAHELFMAGKIGWKDMKSVLLPGRRVFGRYESHQSARYTLAAVTNDDAHEAAELTAGFASGYVYFHAIERKLKHGAHPADADEQLMSRAEFERNAESEKQTLLLREIIGNPFQAISVDPAWLTPKVVGFAQAAYKGVMPPAAQLDPARLGVLASALEETGCHDAEMLGNCRQSREHVRGCWVIDLLLGKE